MNANAEMSVTPPEKKKRFQFPHVFVLLFGVIIIAAFATYFIPAGEYERVVNDAGRTVVVDGTYQSSESSPAGFFSVFQAIHKGMVESASIIFYIFIVGGSFGILRDSGAIEGAVGSISRKMSGKELMLIPVLMVFFSLGGAMLGLAEETLPYITIVLPLALMLGYDSIIGTAIVLLGTAAGFTAAFMNPFTLGVAQGIAEIPMFSGMGLRLVFYFVYLALAIWYVMRYAVKVKRNPEHSVVYEEDKAREPMEMSKLDGLSARHKVIFGILVLTLIGLAIGVIQAGWFITEISGLFLLMGILIGFTAKMSLNEIAESFIRGCKVLVMGALVVGVAHGILVVLQDAKAMDTILYGLSNMVGAMPSGFSAVGMFLVQCMLNFIVPSGSGQAALTMPIMAPLSDLVGVSRQVAVLAFQFGDGISNIFSPTSGYFMAGLALAGIPWIKWAKWILPLIVIQYTLGAVLVTIAHLIGFQ
ncbi:YfcC family protein [Bacillus tianshenii]|nr:YfcC family protein [Bacillus tianshenii]